MFTIASQNENNRGLKMQQQYDTKGLISAKLRFENLPKQSYGYSVSIFECETVQSINVQTFWMVFGLQFLAISNKPKVNLFCIENTLMFALCLLLK